MEPHVETRLIGIITSLSREMWPQPADAAEKLSSLDGIRGVLLDVYGTLFVSGSGDIGVASQRSSGAAMKDALTAAGISSDAETLAGERADELFLQEIQRTHDELRGLGIEYPEVDIRETWRAVLQALSNEGVTAGNVSDEIIMRLAVEYECRTNPVWPMPGLAEVLGTLRSRGLRLGIVSNAQFYTPLLFAALCNTTIDGLGFSPAFRTWSYLLREAKPSVRLFRKTLDALERDFDIAPSGIVYVGNDMLNDILPAATAGCRTVLFAGDKRSLRLRKADARCDGLLPDAVITDLRQLPGLLA